MTSNFPKFANAVRRQFEEMKDEQLLVVDVDPDMIWAAYLESFPEGGNPMFRQRTEHDCSCCRAFLKQAGNIVAYQNGAMTSIWDVNGVPWPYQDVADAMSAYVKSLPIRDALLVPQAKIGTDRSIELLDGNTLEWSHFSIVVPHALVAPDHVSKRGEIRTAVATLKRGLEELAPDAVAGVWNLIEDKMIYRGEEFRTALGNFMHAQNTYLADDNQARKNAMLWALATRQPLTHFRNTVIGTLVQDLSEGKPLEDAVRLYESKVAPQNYKRPTALITPAMIKSAMETITELGLEPALARRHARFEDMTANNVLFVDNSVQHRLKGGLEEVLLKEAKEKPFDPQRAELIDIQTFLAGVLPKTTSLQVYLENDKLNNLMSLTAPENENVQQIFSWDNNFAWSYDGNVADSIKERVKRAGGRVENVAFRVSLAWFNTDDLDLHMTDPTGNHIFYGNKHEILDVDMNVRETVRDPVENMRWLNQPQTGEYTIYVNQYTRRESVDVGFEIEIEGPDGQRTLRYEKALADGEDVPVATVEWQDGKMTVKPRNKMIDGAAAQEKWGLRTNRMVKVQSVILSPNHWDGNAIGNRHWFFILDGCKNPLPTRGIYNEFLPPKLKGHRKVFEVLGDKTKCPVADNQLSGLGFSSTRGDKLTVVATGRDFTRAYQINFGRE